MTDALTAGRVPGVLLTEPKIRGWLQATPTGRALRVRFFTNEGRELLSLRAVEVETALIEVPRPPGSDPALERHPGSLWFYGPNGETLGFRTDIAETLLTRPLALERPPAGPSTPRTLASLQESLRGVLGGLENLAAYLEGRARRYGNREIAADVAGDVRNLARQAGDFQERDPDRRARFVASILDGLESVLRAARSSALATEDSRAAATRFEPVAELARRVLERELDALRVDPDRS